VLYDKPMSESVSLLDLYYDEDHEVLFDRLTELSDSDEPVPIGDLMAILYEADNLDVIIMVTETLVHRIDDVDNLLITDYYPNGNDVIKRHIITILTASMKSRYFQFLLDEYFKNPYMRPSIRSVAFTNKAVLLMNLVRYVESLPLTPETVTVIQQILRTIPRDVVTKTGHVFGGTVLMDVYYAMPHSDWDSHS